MNAKPFRDLRGDEGARERFAGVVSPTPVVVQFCVFVRRDDGVLVKFHVESYSRYSAARMAEATLQAQQRRRGTAAVVLFGFDPRECPLRCEAQGDVDFLVVVESAAGIRAAVSVRASDRQTALELATARFPACRPVFGRARYLCVGTCRSCGVPLFCDNRIRRVADGWKCLDDP